MATFALGTGEVVQIDDADLPIVQSRRWRRLKVRNIVYVRHERVVNGKSSITLLHRLLAEVTDSTLVVDHINGDTLDNRRCNLRVCTPGENQRNQRGHSCRRKSRFKGVFSTKNVKSPLKWAAAIRVNGKSYRLGRFLTEEQARDAYNVAAPRLHGEFARLSQ